MRRQSTRTSRLGFAILLTTMVSNSATWGQQVQQGAVRRPATPAQAPQRAATTAPAPTAAELAANQRAMDTLLVQWEAKSSQLKSLEVGLERLDENPVWGTTDLYKGMALLQSPNLACLQFDKNVAAKGETPKFVQHDRIVCTGKEVYQYLYETTQIFIYPLDREARKRALEEGPLPFLFNMKAADAKIRYNMSLLQQNEKQCLIAIVPRLQIDQESFSKAFVILNKLTFLPDKMVLIAPNGKDRQTFTVTSIAQNTTIDPKFLSGGVYNGWKVIRNPKPEDIQQGTGRGPGVGQTGGPRGGAGARQPAMRPGQAPLR